MSGMLLIELFIIIPSFMAMLSAVLQMLLVIRNYFLQVSIVWFTLLSSDVLKHESCAIICGNMTIACSWLFNKFFRAKFHTKVKGMDWMYIFVPLE